MGLGGHEKSGVTATGKSGCQFHSLLVPAFRCSSVSDMCEAPIIGSFRPYSCEFQRLSARPFPSRLDSCD